MDLIISWNVDTVSMQRTTKVTTTSEAEVVFSCDSLHDWITNETLWNKKLLKLKQKNIKKFYLMMLGRAINNAKV